MPATSWSDWSKRIIKFLFYILTWSLIIQAGRAELNFIAIDTCTSIWICTRVNREIRGSGERTSFIHKKYVCRLFLANQQSTNDEYNHYTHNLSTDNVPLSAHTNNYLIKLVILLNKTSSLPGPANFPNIIRIILEVLPCPFSANMTIFSSYTSTLYYTLKLTNIIWIAARDDWNHVYVIQYIRQLVNLARWLKKYGYSPASYVDSHE